MHQSTRSCAISEISIKVPDPSRRARSSKTAKNDYYFYIIGMLNIYATPFLLYHDFYAAIRIRSLRITVSRNLQERKLLARTPVA